MLKAEFCRKVRRICLYYVKEKEPRRWISGDQFVRQFIRRFIRRKPRVGGVEKVFVNLCKGLDRLGIAYETNLSFRKLQPNDKVGVLGRGRRCLDGYNKSNPIVAGIGLMGHPSEWPTLCEEYPVVTYLQHSEWTNNVYKPYFGERCKIWPVGIDTHEWQALPDRKEFDFLVYDKILWDRECRIPELLQPIQAVLNQRKLTSIIFRYGSYNEGQYKNALTRSRAMIFLCEHESQGLAYQEALASGVPILAWDQGWWLDPNRFRWGDPQIPATSVPYFDQRCGTKFSDFPEFSARLDEFLDKLHCGEFHPRDYILENLTLEGCSRRYCAILDEVAEKTS